MQTKPAWKTPGLRLACNRFAAMTLVLRQHFSVVTMCILLCIDRRKPTKQQEDAGCQVRLPHLRCILQEAQPTTGKHAASSDLKYGPKIASVHPKQPPDFSRGWAHEDGRGL